ncbi:MAG: hypothetical protein KAS73_11670, partial [Candidatus Sabulitectum sp.]|nr:hypothetical protein [Candidatus Sabulitectum sp.]
SMFGAEGADPSSTMGTYSYVSWVPKLNEYVDGKIGATITTPSDENFEVCYAYLNLHFTDNFTLSGGQMNIPFGYAYTRSSGSMLFADRSMIVGGDFGNYGGKDNMAVLTAKFAPVTVDLALSNGVSMRAAAIDSTNKQFTARLAVDPTEWLTIGGSMAMVGEADDDDTEDVDESWSSNGIDIFAVANYPVTSTGTLNFVGEYMILGQTGVIAEDADSNDGSCMSVMLAYDAQLNGDVIMAIQPAVRYDMVDPIADVDDNNYTAIDFCVGVEVFSNKNTFQIGARNYGFENTDVENGGTESYTDIYAKWRINF